MCLMYLVILVMIQILGIVQQILYVSGNLEGIKKSNILIYGDDLIGNEYGDRENAARIMLGDYSLLQFMDDGDGWDFSRDELIWGRRCIFWSVFRSWSRTCCW